MAELAVGNIQFDDPGAHSPIICPDIAHCIYNHGPSDEMNSEAVIADFYAIAHRCRFPNSCPKAIRSHTGPVSYDPD